MLELVTRTLVEQLQAAVLANTVITTHSDALEIASLPIVIVFQPELELARPDHANENEVVKDEDAGTVQITLPGGIYDLGFDIEIVAELTREVLAIGQSLLVWLNANPYLVVDGQEHEMETPEPLSRPSRTSTANLRRAAGRLMVRDVELPSGIYHIGKLAKELSMVYTNERGGEDPLQYSLKRG
ncbi:MAG: hypothetical protein ACM3X6_02840 [Patescibacteria group bacterium]